MEFYSTIKKNEICRKMNGSRKNNVTWDDSTLERQKPRCPSCVLEWVDEKRETKKIG